MKKLAALASMAALLCASTSFAKKTMNEEEMELVTAAGQPAIIVVDYGASVSSSLTITADEMGTITQTIDTGSQTNLRALALNNVAGENQVANAVNIQSGVSSTGPDSAQSNEINQSWGATLDWSFAPGTVGDAGDGGDVTISGSIGDVKINCIAVGAGVACAAADVANGGDGGDAAAIDNVKLSAYADKIIGVTNVSGISTINVSQMNAQTITQSILEGSQTTLAALALNNVAGSNQVANGVNLSSRGTTVIGNSAGTPIIVVDSLAPGTVHNGVQSNLINQYRGTPLTRPDVCVSCPVLPLIQ